MRGLRPSLFKANEWSEIRGRLGRWAAACLDAPLGWFRDLDELTRLEGIASAIGVPVDKAAFTKARATLADSQPPQWEETRASFDRTGPQEREWTDDLEIDALFGMLAN